MSNKEVINTLISDYSRQAKLSERERQIYELGILNGMDIANQMMMNDAVPGRISVNRFGNKVVSSWPGIQQLEQLHTYDKVKLIIVKED